MTVALVAVRSLGASGLTAVVITGQLAISVVIDRFGLFGITRQQIDVSRILGLVLLSPAWCSSCAGRQSSSRVAQSSAVRTLPPAVGVGSRPVAPVRDS